MKYELFSEFFRSLLEITPSLGRNVGKQQQSGGALKTLSGDFAGHVVLSGLWGYIIGAVWLAIGVLLALPALLFLCHRNRKKERQLGTENTLLWQAIGRNASGGGFSSQRRSTRPSSPVLLALFVVAAVPCIVGIGLGYGANSYFYHEVEVVANLVRTQTSQTVQTAKETAGVLRDAGTELEGFPCLPQNIQSLAVDGASTLEDLSSSLGNSILSKVDTIYNFVNASRIVVYTLLSLSVVLLLLGTPTIFCKRFWPLTTLLLLLWLLGVATWVWVGLSFAEHTASVDSCHDVDIIKESIGSSTLSPCSGFSGLSSTVSAARVGLVICINRIIRRLNRAAPSIPIPPSLNLCTRRNQSQQNCSSPQEFVQGAAQYYSDVVSLNPEAALENFPPVRMQTAVPTVSLLIQLFPQLESIANCVPVNETASTISANFCPGLLWGSDFLWSSLLVLSVGIIVVCCAWFTYLCLSCYKIGSKIKQAQQFLSASAPPYSPRVEVPSAGVI